MGFPDPDNHGNGIEDENKARREIPGAGQRKVAPHPETGGSSGNSGPASSGGTRRGKMGEALPMYARAQVPLIAINDEQASQRTID
jgi:hypothetical protein